MSHDAIELYCTFYLNSTRDLSEIDNLIFEKIKNVTSRKGSIKTDILTICSFRNPDRSCDDFMCWPYRLDVEPIEEDTAEYTSFVNAAKELNHILKSNGVDVVVSCDFEDEFK
ncbi:hypothetical protein [Serratia sp. 2723]|uniref:hypothetical protein n=1 Tax=unclassified Serratia (in: enterobacteria) TaxID=2647522 RepID=UPI003D1FC10B